MRGGGERGPVRRRGVAGEQRFQGGVLLGEELREMERGVGIMFVERVACGELALFFVCLFWERGDVPTTLAVRPLMLLPERSTCWMVGLEGDFMIFTCWEGAQGWAVTKLISFASVYVCSVIAPVSTSVTEKVMAAA